MCLTSDDFIRSSIRWQTPSPVVPFTKTPLMPRLLIQAAYLSITSYLIERFLLKKYCRVNSEMSFAIFWDDFKCLADFSGEIIIIRGKLPVICKCRKNWHHQPGIIEFDCFHFFLFAWATIYAGRWIKSKSELCRVR